MGAGQRGGAARHGMEGYGYGYRQEYRPWTGAKPSKPIKTKQGFIIPDDHFVQETSYKADYKAPSRILNV